jgi:hypothetical protein
LGKVGFTTGIMAGGDGWAWAMDEYGRHPGDPQYQNEKMREREWEMHERSKHEWAKKRVGKSIAQIDKFEHGDVDDRMMKKYLRGEGLLPPAEQPIEVKIEEPRSDAGNQTT